MDNPPWYSQGLRFKCTGCGRCCTGTPGVVWISEEEIAAAAQFLGISKEDFCKTHVRKLGDRLALVERKRLGQFDCTFLQGKQCSIYPVRPRQCKTFPWWTENLSSPQDWESAGAECEGINHPDAPLITLEQIQKSLE